MTKNELGKKIREIAYLQGEFRLRSGQISSEYFDKYRFESQPNILQEIAAHLAPMIPEGIDFLAGLELGGVPIATALSLRSEVPVLFVRKEAKTYGTCQFAEGGDFKNKKLLIVEDVITTGGQVLDSVADLRKHGALIEDVFCVIYRGPKGENPLEKANLTLKFLFTKEELLRS